MVNSIILSKVFCHTEKKDKIVKFTMMPNALVRDGNFNDSEFRLLSYYQSFTDAKGTRGSINFKDSITKEALGWSLGKLERTKKKLKEKGWLYIKQSGYYNYDYYIGHNAKELYEATIDNQDEVEENIKKANESWLGKKDDT